MSGIEVSKMVVGIGADASGFTLKEAILQWLNSDARVERVIDFGVHSIDDPTFYSEVGLQTAEQVRAGELHRAILVCGTGIGMMIAANKVPGVYATVAYDMYSVERSILSNNCQVLCLGGKVVGPEVGRRIVDAWLNYSFDPTSRSAAKVAIIQEYERHRHGVD